ncbi:MAG: hypothetical protein J5835_02395 [Bacteroidales bacterium]|nr:hypothetical protein [Bacteroidales bacterium]
MRRTAVFFTVLLCAGALSCKSLVLENRTECPAMLFIDLEDETNLEGNAAVRIAVRDVNTSRILAADTPHLEDLDPERYSLEIHKAPLIFVSGVTGVIRSQEDGSPKTLTIPCGMEGDPIYLFTSTVPAMDDQLLVPAKLRKEYSRLTLRFSLEDGVFPYHVTMAGNTSGIDMISGKPVCGPFRCEPEELSPGVFSCIVPRQSDNLLSLEIMLKEGLTDKEDFSGTLFLSNYLSRIPDFSWTMENLPDITLDIDFFHLSITVTVNDWNVAQTVNLTI